jgi:hypothetical protein
MGYPMWATESIESSALPLATRISQLRKFHNLTSHVSANFKDLCKQWLAISYTDSNPYVRNEVYVESHGLSTPLRESQFENYWGVSAQFINEQYPNLQFTEADRYAYILVPKSKAKGTLLGDSYNKALANGLSALANCTVRDLESNPDEYFQVIWRNNRERLYTNDSGTNTELVYGAGAVRLINYMFGTVAKYRPTASEVWTYRRNAIEEERNRVQHRESTLNSDKFRTYWDDMKSRIRAKVSSTEVEETWKNLKQLDWGASSSRSWGIEIEVVQNNLVSRRPPGWDEKSDGSLSGLSNDCECGCDDCDDGSHCGYDDCISSDETAEYVSPVLMSYNSRGLKMLCDDLDGSEVNETPGIHVHVGAGDLTARDVSRLVTAYSTISPFLRHIDNRQVRGYCKDISTSNVQFWLASARSDRNTKNETPAVDAVYYQPDDRYHDLNLRALQAHGTIEFRVMGPIYNYAHLTKWAWFCREMVNVSRLDLPQSLWTSAKSFKDVVNILIANGSESTPEWLEESVAH